jgi:hypothetical protein
MKNSAKIALVALAAIVLVSTVAVLTPRATHASATPAPIIILADAARIPWVTSCDATPASSSGYASCTTSAIPAGHEFVIQTVTIDTSYETVNTNDVTPMVWMPRALTTGGGQSMVWEAQIPNPITEWYDQPNHIAFAILNLTTNTTIYADPGTSIDCSMSIGDDLFVSPKVNPLTFTFTGYLVQIDRARAY